MRLTWHTVDWTQWGFHWHTCHNVPITDPSTQAQTNPAYTPNTRQPGSTTTNGTSPATPVAHIGNLQLTNNQNGIHHPTWLTATNPQQTLATIPPAQINPAYTPNTRQPDSTTTNNTSPTTSSGPNMQPATDQ